MFENCERDFVELCEKEIDACFFEDYGNVRIVNSFLFNFSKLQDKIGAKLFKKALYELKEIDNESISMIDALNLLEKLEIIANVEEWDELREIRNSLAHEYHFSPVERIDNTKLAMDGYKTIKKIYGNLKERLYETWRKTDKSR